MKSRRGKVRRSLALFLALALIFTTFLGDVSIVNAQEATETEASADEKPEKQEKPKEKEAPAEEPQKKSASEEKSQEKETPAEKPQEKETPAEKPQEKSEAAEKPQEKSDSAEKQQAEPEKESAAEETKQPEVKDDGSESADVKADDKAETPKDDASSKDKTESDKEDDAEKKAEKYTVRFKVNNSDAGVITVDGSSVNAASYKKDVEEGKDFKFGVTAKEGFEVESVKAENADVARNGAVKDGYVVKEVKKDLEIAVQYKEVPKEENPEEEENIPEETKEVPEETEEIPEAVKTFLDAAAALPSADSVTKENAEKVGRQVNAVLSMWEAMDEELAEREDVQAALEKVYAVYEAVLKAEGVEDAKGYAEARLPYSSTSGVTQSAFENAVNLNQADVRYGSVRLNGEEETDSGTPNVWATGAWGGAVNVTGYNWVHVINTNPDVATVSYETEGGRLIITFKPGQKSGTTKISVGVDAKYYHSGMNSMMNMNLNFDYTVTNIGGGEVVPGNKPAKPTVNDVPTANQNGYVYVKCVTYPNANPLSTTRQHAGFISLRNSAEGWSCGEVYANDGRFGSDAPAAKYPWLCDLTLNSNWYLERWNSNFSNNDGIHYLNDPGEIVSMTFVSDGEDWYYFTNDVPLVVWITHKEVTYYTVKYTDGVKDEEVFKDQVTSWLKEGDKTPEFKAADKGTIINDDKTVEPYREGYTFNGWSPTVKQTVTGADANGNKEIIYEATWLQDEEPVKQQITDFEKKLVKSAAEVPSGLSIKPGEITYPNVDGKVVIPDDESITLLYKITVTGDPGTEYRVIDTGAIWVGGAAMQGKIPESGKAVIYVTREFYGEDIEDGKVRNTAKVTPGIGDDSSNSTETTPAGTPENTTLKVTKSADKDSVKKGDTIVYTITVKNTGACEAKNVVITDKLDSSMLEFIRAELGDKTFNAEPTDGQYPAGNIPVGGSVSLTITAKVKDNVKPEDVIHNTADADLDNPADDVTPDSKDVPVGGSSLDVTKSRIGDAEVVAGSTIKWKITITNNTNQVKTVEIRDVLSNQEEITVTEDEDGKNAVSSVTLQAGEKKTLYASYVTKDTDINLTLKNKVIVKDKDDDKEAEDEGTKVVSPDRKVTIKYVSDQGEELKSDRVVGPFKDGESYDVNSQILPAIDKDGHHYIKEKVEGAVEGTINGDDVIIKVIYTVDDIGTDPQEKRTVTVFYVDEDGNEIMPKYTETKNYGDSYDVSDKLGEETFKDEATGNTYVKDRVEGKPTGDSITEDVEIRVVYKLDNTEPEDPTPEDPTPEDPTPEDPTPEDPTPEDPTPENPTPEDPTPEDPTPEDPTPEDSTPETPAPEDPTPETLTPVEPAPTTPVITSVTPTITPTTPTTPIIARITPTPVTPAVTPAELTPVAPVLTPGGEEAEPEEQPEVRAVEDEEAPLANTEIKDEEVPLAGSSDRWALINFALMNLAIFESLMLLIGYFVQTKKSSDEEEDEKEEDEKEIKLKKKGIIRLISLPVAIVSLIAFFLTENIWLPTKLVDEYTLMMAIIALFQTVVVALSRKEENAEEKEPEAEAEMA